LLCCWLKIASAWLWIVDIASVGVKTMTLEPRSPPPGSGLPVGGVVGGVVVGGVVVPVPPKTWNSQSE